MATSTLVSDQTEPLLAICKTFLASFCSSPPLAETPQYVLPGASCSMQHGDEPRGLAFPDLIQYERARLADLYESGVKAYEHVLAKPSPTVRLRDNIALVALEYIARVDGKQTHRGVSLISFLQADKDHWRIAGLADRRWPGTESIPAPVSSEPATEIMTLLEAFMDNLKHYRWDALSSVLLEGGGATLSRRPHLPEGAAWPEFLERLQRVTAALPPGTVIEEKIYNCECECYGDLAFAWTPFVVAIDGKERSRGVNIFTLMQRDGGWAISGLQDTHFI